MSTDERKLADRVASMLTSMAAADSLHFREIDAVAALLREQQAEIERWSQQYAALLEGHGVLMDERDSLRRDLDAVNAAHDKLLGEHIKVMDERNQLRRDLEAARVDAERYRWVRDAGHIGPHRTPYTRIGRGYSAAEIDASIDAAIDLARAGGPDER